jgi:hypothetical protein
MMSHQPTLLDPKPVEFSIPEEHDAPARATGLMLSDPQPPSLMEFRETMMFMSPERRKEALTFWWDGRVDLREWILSKLTEGLHYGFVPGCEPKYCDSKGKLCAKEVAWGTLGYKGSLVPLESWKPKPGLYDAGAALIRDLMWVYSKESADMETWEQLGKQPGHIVRKSQLFSRINDKFLGEGTGARLLGQKGGDINNSVKMADKNARVAATINTWSLQDLFEIVEPTDDPNPPKRPSPEADPNVATAQPRGERYFVEDIKGLSDRWKKCENPNAQGFAEWQLFVHEKCGRTFGITKPSQWTKADFEAVDAALKARDA